MGPHVDQRGRGEEGGGCASPPKASAMHFRARLNQTAIRLQASSASRFRFRTPLPPGHLRTTPRETYTLQCSCGRLPPLCATSRGARGGCMGARGLRIHADQRLVSKPALTHSMGHLVSPCPSPRHPRNTYPPTKQHTHTHIHTSIHANMDPHPTCTPTPQEAEPEGRQRLG